MSVRAQVCLKGTLFTPLSAHNTSTQSLNPQHEALQARACARRCA